ncbi:5'-3' exoribonuclease 1 isoform X2 [Aricia agestis]|uniref:5'-3' exoribonuclease 1 isoform X2 n=1 Tax=Aricia agestis TaxID=91739 RepID=UPI001C203195|nr:5'-3' exoribonuclease 1 isoform X2 [Aricia agestis]
MGVPKFFRYTSERYPCLNELVKQHQIPEFDNMYLDMNGIIHNCSHPDDSDPHFRITEEKIFQDIFHYLDILFQIIKPKKLFFMAIDGVAPRAKMNQQRGRRFRSAKEAERLEELAKAKGEVLPAEKRFDSNCITPGTVFMARLHEQLKYFIKQKISQDPLWSKVKVILSGHETPGEGEHKIMDYIRWARTQPDYDPNTRHCLYGLDADLIMLGVCTHEPHFALLREEVKFGKNTKRAATPEETNFYLLHLPLLKEYLEQEFIELKDKLPFKFDIEKILDDWVLMGFLVGNDFIPNLPNMHISNDMLPHLYRTYIKVLPTLEGYINEAGILNLARFEAFMQELAKIDMEKFSDIYADLKYFEGKTGRRPNANERKEYKPNNDDTFNVNIDDIKANKPDDELQALINATQEMFMENVEDDDDDEYEDIDSSDEEANMQMEFILHKKDYYMNKLDYSKVTDEVLSDQATCYVRAIQWNLHYYYRGCASWCWFYPHHYAPYISDIKGFKDLKIEFELGEPFKPFEQLLAVLPAASKNLLPTPFHDLMTDEDSPIVHYYPCHFETDLNGKKNDWEAVVLIPFIDEANLLSAMTPCYQRLTDEELKRNSHGPMLIYQWTPDNLGPAVAPDYFPTVPQCHAHEKLLWRKELEVPPERLICGLLPNADPSLLYPGFPTMRHLKYTSSIRKCKVKVFDQPSRNDSMIIEIAAPADQAFASLEKVAQEYLGKVVWVSWPHLTRAKVLSVSNEKMRLHHVDKQNNNVDGLQYSTEQNVGNLHKQWISERSTIIEHNMSRLGIDLGQVDVIIHAATLTGYKYVLSDGGMVVREQWSTRPCGYAVQAVVRTVRAAPRPPPRFTSPADAYPPGSTCFLLTKSNYYGCKATVISTENIRTKRVTVRVCERPEPAPRPPPADSALAYKTANHAAAACGITAQMLSRLTGCVFVVLGERNDLPTETQNKVNVGLNLKFNKKNQEVCGYTRRCNVTGAWLYSSRCVSLLQAYARAHPTLFDRLASSCGNDVFFESDIWPGQVGQDKPQEVSKWLKAQAHAGAPKRECGSEVLEPEEMRVVLEDVKKQLEELKGAETNVTLHIKWNLLYTAELEEGDSPADPEADFSLLDRVVVVRGADKGARGTVVGVVRGAAPAAVRLADKLHAPPSYQVMLDDQPLTDEPAYLRLSGCSLLNVTWGRGLPRAAPQPAFANVNPLRSRPDARSAFAAYSPPREILSRPADRNNATTCEPPKPEQATNLLKNLLKISADGQTDNKQNHKATEQSNWRAKEPTRQASPDKFPPQQNWRKENHYKKPPPAHNNEWTNNSNFNNQPPLPPYPTFGQPFTMPGPSQIPFPQFQTFQQRNQFGFSANQENRSRNQQFGNQEPRNQQFGNQEPRNQQFGNQELRSQQFGNQEPRSQQFGNQEPRNQRNQENRNESRNQNNRGFPQHLPAVGAVSLAPSWVANQGQSAAPAPKPTAAAPEKITNPFVPLQVQTSRRRVKNGPTIQKGLEGVKAPVPIQPAPTVLQPTAPPVNSQQQRNSQKPKKRKPRIAANLPFQLE